MIRFVIALLFFSMPGTALADYQARIVVAPLDKNQRIYPTLEARATDDSLLVKYTVLNVAEEDLRFVYNSTQQYDFVLRDQGREIWRWSKDKFFGYQVWKESLAPDSSIVITEQLPRPAGYDALDLEAYLTLSQRDSADVTREETRTRTTVIDTKAVVVGGSKNPLKIDVSLNHHRFAVGDTLRLKYRATNRFERDLALTFPSSQSFDLVVYGSSGLPLWHWSDGRVFVTVWREEVLRVGETYTFEAVVVVPPSWADAMDESLAIEAFLAIADPPASGLIRRMTAITVEIEITVTGKSVARRSDFDGSGTVDFDDFVAFAAAFGTRSGDPQFRSNFDLNDSGQVDLEDFILFANSFGWSE